MIDTSGEPPADSGAVVGAAVGGAAGGSLLIIVIAVLMCRSRRSEREHEIDDNGGGGGGVGGGGAIEMIPDNPGDRAYTAGPPVLERQYSDPIDVRRPISAPLYERPGAADSSRPRF